MNFEGGASDSKCQSCGHNASDHGKQQITPPTEAEVSREEEEFDVSDEWECCLKKLDDASSPEEILSLFKEFKIFLAPASRRKVLPKPKFIQRAIAKRNALKAIDKSSAWNDEVAESFGFLVRSYDDTQDWEMEIDDKSDDSESEAEPARPRSGSAIELSLFGASTTAERRNSGPGAGTVPTQRRERRNSGPGGGELFATPATGERRTSIDMGMEMGVVEPARQAMAPLQVEEPRHQLDVGGYYLLQFGLLVAAQVVGLLVNNYVWLYSGYILAVALYFPYALAMRKVSDRVAFQGARKFAGAYFPIAWALITQYLNSFEVLLGERSPQLDDDDEFEATTAGMVYEFAIAYVIFAFIAWMGIRRLRRARHLARGQRGVAMV